MVTAYFVTLQFNEEALEADLRILGELTKLDGHVLRVQQNLLLQRSSNKLKHQHLFRRTIIAHLNINLGVPLHEINQIDKPIDLLGLQAQLLQIRPVHLVNHLLQRSDLLHLEYLLALLKVVGLEPVGHLVEFLGGVLLDYKLIVLDLEHAHPGLLVQVNCAIGKLIRNALAGPTHPDPGARLAAGIAQDIFTVFHKFDLRMLFGEAC